MCNDIKVIKKEVNAFLLINFGLIAFVSVFVFICVSKPDSANFIANFAGLFMYIPAFSVIVVLKKVSNYSFTPTVDKFFRFFAITTVIRIVVCIAETFLFKGIGISSIIDTVTSGYLLFVVLMNSSDFEVLNLSMSKNFKKVLFILVLFLIIIVASNVLDFIFTQSEPVDIGSNVGMAVMSIFINFLFGFNLFFGEEFGWRYFLQPRLQKLYGKRYGVIILGLIWGIWHLPLCMTLYSPQTPLYCIVSHLAYCTLLGIFLGYAYMKTQNIWAPILIHLVNNSISIIFMGGYESVITPESLLWSIVSSTIFFLPFLLTKEYRSNKVNEIV